MFILLSISGKLNLSSCDCLFLVPDTNLTNIRLENIVMELNLFGKCLSHPAFFNPSHSISSWLKPAFKRSFLGRNGYRVASEGKGKNFLETPTEKKGGNKSS